MQNQERLFKNVFFVFIVFAKNVEPTGGFENASEEEMKN